MWRTTTWPVELVDAGLGEGMFVKSEAMLSPPCIHMLSGKVSEHFAVDPQSFIWAMFDRYRQSGVKRLPGTCLEIDSIS
jgi:hypothetical protein